MAPKGAVTKIAKTATVNTISPHANPMESGIVPIAACTVALGVYAIAQNTLSFLFKSVFSKDMATPLIRNINANTTNITTTAPAATA